MRTDHGGGVPESTAFAQTLADLKREGSNLLLVGDVPTDAHGAVCRRLIGEDASEPRQRLFIFTVDAQGCAHLPDPGEPGSARIIRQDAGAADVYADHVPETVVESDLLSALGFEVLSGLDDIEAEVPGDLDPAELRVCFDAVRPLLQRHRSETVFRLLHMITSRVRQVNGMGHFHLSLAHDNDYVRLLEPLFDAVVEVRVDDGSVEQRWHLRDSEVSSGWLAL